MAQRMKQPPIVVGSGPAGLFCALALARAGLPPIILERGKDVDRRQTDVELFWKTGVLQTNSNVQFGEGGAGTFSDGKLTTGVHGPYVRRVLEEFVNAGAPSEILYRAKPHIGTDHLREVVKNLRRIIQEHGGEFRFEHQFTGFSTENGRLCSVRAVRAQTPEHAYSEAASAVVLAIGHSARDTFSMLLENHIRMEQKNFSVGVRIEHPQEKIDQSQYGKFAGHPALGPADYKLSAHLADGRGVYTFCMCPGGRVVAAASEENHLVTNGMSRFARDERNTNSALLVSVDAKDFGGDHPLAGVQFQKNLERRAFALGGGGFIAPAQLAGDFLLGRESCGVGEVGPSYRPGVRWTDLRGLFSGEITRALQQAILLFGQKIEGFSSYDAVLTAVESRSSSPVRIWRGASGASSAAGLYPCGVGAGYAGGIVSAAVDGMKCAQTILTSN
ncbi:MAG: FAD-binding protein [Clostridiales bacterium]|nr:FAD-binding protein [Clostridiales bacterium]